MPTENLRLDMSARSAPHKPGGVEIRPGDICRTRHGRLYLIFTIPPPSRSWRTSQYAYYFTLSNEGELLRTGQCMLGYIQENWEVIGHCDITVGQPVWGPGKSAKKERRAIGHPPRKP